VAGCAVDFWRAFSTQHGHIISTKDFAIGATFHVNEIASIGMQMPPLTGTVRTTGNVPLKIKLPADCASNKATPATTTSDALVKFAYVIGCILTKPSGDCAAEKTE
jgi:hypothetical protein